MQNLILQKSWQPVKETGKHLWGFCVFHVDKNTPNLSIDKTSETKGRFRCWACGIYGNIPPKLVDTMAKKKVKNLRERPSIKWHERTVRFLVTKLDENFVYLKKLADDWNIDVETLFSYYVGIFEDWSDHHKSYTIPMRNEHKEIIGIQSRYLDGSKSCIEGSQLGLFIPHILIENRRVVICEGFSDAAVVTDLGFFGAGLPSASVGHEMMKTFLDTAGVKKVTIVADNDSAGKKSAEKMNKLLSDSYKCRVIMPEETRDLRSLYNLKGRDYII